jgi:hypothetical protein
MTILIDDTFGRNSSAQLANSDDIQGGDIFAANLAALQGNTDLNVLTVGQWGTALDTGKKYTLTTKNNGSPTPHVWTEFIGGSGSPSSVNAIYFGMGGSDLNSGLTNDARLLTYPAAYTKAKTAFGTLSETNRAVCICFDAGYYGDGYSDTININAEWIDVYAPNATLAYAHNMSAGNNSITAKVVGDIALQNHAITCAQTNPTTIKANKILCTTPTYHAISISVGAAPLLFINVDECLSFVDNNTTVVSYVYANFGAVNIIGLSPVTTGSIIANICPSLALNGNTTCPVFIPSNSLTTGTTEELNIVSNGQTSFTLSNTPTSIFGVILDQGSFVKYGTDFMVAGNVLTWLNPNGITMDIGDTAYFLYAYTAGSPLPVTKYMQVPISGTLSTANNFYPFDSFLTNASSTIGVMYTFDVPDDFTSLVSFVLPGFVHSSSAGAGPYNYTITVNHSSNGELVSAHTSTFVKAKNFTGVVATTLQKPMFDLTTDLASIIAPGRKIGIAIVSDLTHHVALSNATLSYL